MNKYLVNAGLAKKSGASMLTRTSTSDLAGAKSGGMVSLKAMHNGLLKSVKTAAQYTASKNLEKS